MSYEQRVSLQLNIDRVHAAETLRHVDALEIAAGKRTVPEEWFLWLTYSQAESQRLIAEQNLSLLRND